MKFFYPILFCFLFTIVLSTNAQIASNNCNSSLFSINNEYFGGFEAEGDNISNSTAGSDLYSRLPSNGFSQVIKSVKDLVGSGYLNIQPQTGNSFFAVHTSTSITERIWYSSMAVKPGESYNFSVSVTLLKNLGDDTNFIGLYADGEEIGRGRVTFDWTEICGSFTVPQGVTCIELSVRDPKKGLFFLAMDDIKMYNNTLFLGDKKVNQHSVNISNQVKMYPNPANKNVMLNISSTKSTTAQISIIDVAGKIVFKTNTKLSVGNTINQINEIAKLGNGIYYVSINVDGQTTNQKLIVAH